MYDHTFKGKQTQRQMPVINKDFILKLVVKCIICEVWQYSWQKNLAVISESKKGTLGI